MYMQLDVATDVYPMHAGEKFNMVLAPTLDLDGTPDTGYYTQAGRKTLADNYEYVMHGKLYKISEDTSSSQIGGEGRRGLTGAGEGAGCGGLPDEGWQWGTTRGPECWEAGRRVADRRLV
ncbi:unnamed protein product [Miscanthus lutarioriparius]|uniref:Uncharacterized protein n=1 Tax=Miscanthus lutarioriparius TaxID=422564 RepID=A0A811PUF4_9POAL|nr:unnamed protein product [Miscanthus lutarioriparius]